MDPLTIGLILGAMRAITFAINQSEQKSKNSLPTNKSQPNIITSTKALENKTAGLDSRALESKDGTRIKFKKK
jgi:hypothetical protein